ncbi:MAG: MarR family winged helix-turn-helix transcriptional regulator [Clostridia bacterium]
MEAKQVSVEMLKTVNMIKRDIDSRISNDINKDLTSAQAHLITFLYNTKDIYQKDIEEVFKLHRSSVSLMLGNMEKNDLIKRVVDTSDKRLKKIILTEKSEAYYEKIQNVMLDVKEKILLNITQEEGKTIITVLEKMQQNLK